MRRVSKWKDAAGVALGLLASAPAVAPAIAQAPPAKSAAPKSAAKPIGAQANLPTDITADQQEMFNEEHRSVYRGNVVVIQGTDRLNTPQLTVFFTKKDPAAVKVAAAPAPASAGATFGKIERMEAEGPVYFTSATQNAKGDHGTYIAADDTTTLIGNVVLVQNKDVSTGDKLVINRTSNHASLYSKAGPTRVRGVFYQDEPAPAPGAPPKPPKTAGPGKP